MFGQRLQTTAYLVIEIILPRKGREPRRGQLLRFALRRIVLAPLWIGGLTLAAVLMWEGITAQGNPNPLASHSDPTSAILDIGVLVFR